MAKVIGVDEAGREYTARSKERDAFEAELQQEARDRLTATIVNVIEVSTGTYNESLHEAILCKLLARFTRAKDPLMAHFTGLRELPMDDESFAQRLLAFEQVLHHYLPSVLSEEIPTSGNEHPAGVQAEIPDGI